MYMYMYIYMCMYICIYMYIYVYICISAPVFGPVVHGARCAMDVYRARGGAAAHRAHAHPLPQLPGKPPLMRPTPVCPSPSPCACAPANSRAVHAAACRSGASLRACGSASIRPRGCCRRRTCSATARGPCAPPLPLRPPLRRSPGHAAAARSSLPPLRCMPARTIGALQRPRRGRCVLTSAFGA